MSIHTVGQASAAARLDLPKLLAACAAVVMMFTATPGFAQETTSSIRGSVTASDGSPVAGAAVTVTDTRTGNTRRLTTTNAGNFTAGGLRVGGPYTVRVSSPQHADQTITDVMVQLGSAYSFAVTLGDVTMEEVTVTAIAARGAPVAIGPATGFSLDDLENAPAVNRDINDLIRIDPRIYINEADVDGVQCNGASSRYNSLTVDGIKLNDNFGLNRNGYPTQRMPFPYDAIQQVAVELAPFDVQYGGFTAC
ncbi:MAG: TonB-dependent receptor plug domain-containing protein, partial [Gammaproteobacteria bacterium]|nr:TonB-dependent receptor plug domain-containing protein [Gammaproteobacteria bacterium]